MILNKINKISNDFESNSKKKNQVKYFILSIESKYMNIKKKQQKQNM
jgi:hypothetical protein